MLLRFTTLITLLIYQNADGDNFHSLLLNRDLLYKQLFDEVKTYDLQYINNIKDSHQECRSQLLSIHNELYDQIYDSWGSVPVGLYANNFYSLGNYDQCVGIKNGSLVGKYCMTFLKAYESQKEFIKIGICIPEVCDPKFIHHIFTYAEEPTNVYVEQCSNGKNTFNTFTYICFGFGSLIFLLIATSAIYDFKSKEKFRLHSSLICWSLRENLRKTFDTSDSSDEHLSCIDGMRVITMMWLMYYHTYLVTYRRHFEDFADDTNPQKTNVLLHSGVLGVDTFLCISAFLMTYISLKKIDQEGSLNCGKLILRRYLRLAPSMIAVIFAVNGVVGLVNGPHAASFDSLRVCLKNWWVNALMLQSYLEGVSLRTMAPSKIINTLSSSVTHRPGMSHATSYFTFTRQYLFLDLEGILSRSTC